MQIKRVKTTLELINTFKEGKIPLWEGKEPLFRALESNEIKNLDKRDKYTLKVAYYQEFQQPVSILDENIESKNLEELLNKVWEKGLNPQELDYVITSNDKGELFKLLQNFIYLDYYPRIYTKKEIALRKFVEEIKQYLEPIKKGIAKTKEEFNKFLSDSPYLEEKKKETLELLDKIEKAINTLGSDELIKVAVFATKKSGKSMVVNALLNEEFAPTSLELPTPTVIEYHPWDKNYIRVEVGDLITDFKEPKEVKNYLTQLFKEEDTDLKGKKTPVVKIFYPQKKGVNYVIFDTPGPDLAGSQHGDFIDEYIDKSEVAIFIVDYSKYAQDSEIELLKRVVEGFKKRGKENTLLIAVNKVDLMYQDEDTEKIKVRVADFLREKLKSLQVEEPIVIPITALIYFYSQKLAEAIPEIKTAENLRRFLLDLEEQVEEEELTLPISEEIFQTVSNYVGYLRSVQKIKRPTYRDLINSTGFAGLKQYISYIGLEKALIERYVFALNIAVLAYAELKNKIELNRKLINQDKEMLEEILNETLMKLDEENLKEIKQNITIQFEEFKYKFWKALETLLKIKVEEYLSSFFNELEKNKDFTHQRIINILNNMPSTADETTVQEAKKEIKKSIKLLLETYSQELNEERLKKLVKRYYSQDLPSNIIDNLHEEIKSLQKILNEQTEKFKEGLTQVITEIQEVIKREFNVKLNIIIPKLIIPDIGTLIGDYLNQIKLDIDNINFNNLEKVNSAIETRKRGFLEKILTFNWSDYEIYINREFIDDFFRNLDQNFALIQKSIKEVIEKEFKKIYEKIGIQAIQGFYKFQEELNNWENSIRKPLEELKNNIQQELWIKQKLLEMYNSLENSMNEHLNLLQDTLKAFEKLQT